MTLKSELLTNYRLRIGIVLILSIVWWSLLVDLRDQNNVLLDRFKQTTSQLARYSTQQKQHQWVARAQEIKSALTDAEAHLWKNPTIGLTQAEMRDWLLQQLEQAKAANFSVKVSESGGDKATENKGEISSDAPADLILVRARLEFNTDPAVLNNLLKAFANADHLTSVESLSTTQQRTEMNIVSWYKLQLAIPDSTALHSQSKSQ